MIRRLRLFLLICASAAPLVSAASALELAIVPGAEVETVYRSADPRCGTIDGPDAPARAFRDGSGTVRLFATHYTNNRALIGPTLDDVEQDCRLVFSGSDAVEPEQFDNWVWLASFRAEGDTVHALVHNEFHGERHGLCPKERSWACWYNTIVYAVSQDGGNTFRSPPPPDNLVAAAPYPFDPDAANRTGAFLPTNIVEHEGHYYALFVFSSPDAYGICVMRTADLADPKSWRAWDGAGFNVAFADPYGPEGADPEAQTCAPLPGLLKHGLGTVVKHEASGLFVGVQTLPSGAGNESGVYYSTSPDLVQWSAAQLLWPVPTYRDFECPPDTASYAYGSLLDPESPSINFETIGDEPYLYLTRFNLRKCRIAASRDLVRLPLVVRTD